MAIVVDWKIKSRSGVCSHTGEAFTDDEPFYTCIFADPESDGFIRRDYSASAWQEVSASLEPAPFSFWKSVFKTVVAEKKEEAIPQNSVEAMLHRMIEEDRTETENARYILALMLERKKILIPTEKKETENRTLLFYEHKDSGAVYIVSDPGLRLDEVERIQDEVSQLLEEEENRDRPPEEQDAEIEGEADGDVEMADSPSTGEAEPPPPVEENSEGEEE